MRPRCKATTRSGDQCRNLAVEGTTVCYMHGAKAALNPNNGKDGGRPIIHALYSKHIPEEWRQDYEYFKADPNQLSSTAEIAVAQTNFVRFLKANEGQTLDAERAEIIGQHVERITRLKEREAKRVHNDRVVSELLAQQVQQETAILADVLGRYLDADTAQRAAAEFGERVAAACVSTKTVNV